MKKYIIFDFSGTLVKMRPAMLLMSKNSLVRLARLYDLVIITGAKKSETLNILNKLNIKNVFSKIVTKDDTILRKPSPQLFNLVGARKNIVLYTGDSKNDKLMAMSAGICFLNIKDFKQII